MRCPGLLWQFLFVPIVVRPRAESAHRGFQTDPTINNAKAEVCAWKGGDLKMTDIATATDLMRLNSSVLNNSPLETCQLCSFTM